MRFVDGFSSYRVSYHKVIIIFALNPQGRSSTFALKNLYGAIFAIAHPKN